MSAEPIAHWYASFETLRAGMTVDGPRDLSIRGRRIPGNCLAPAEQAELDRFRDPSRREAWNWGRVLAKQLLREQLSDRVAAGDRIEIRSRNGGGQSVRPTVRVNGGPLDVCLSISHSNRGVFVAASTDRQLGVDLVDLSRFKPGSLDAWFTEAEREHLKADDVKRQAVLWAIKESVYKAANAGEPFAPKSIEVDLTGPRCRYRGRDFGDDCRIHVNDVDGHVAVMAAWQSVDRTDMNRAE
ncbi:MAG: 4'-phosphopantetheinyl transferase family protein [Planctomycetaceae bacterium]